MKFNTHKNEEKKTKNNDQEQQQQMFVYTKEGCLQYLHTLLYFMCVCVCVRVRSRRRRRNARRQLNVTRWRSSTEENSQVNSSGIHKPAQKCRVSTPERRVSAERCGASFGRDFSDLVGIFFLFFFLFFNLGR